MTVTQVRSNLDFLNTARIENLPAAVATGQPVTFEQFNAQIEGLAWKDNCRVAANVNVNLSAPGATIDSITMSLNDRFLAGNQSSQTQNGIYIWNGASTPATRALDANTFAELESAVVTIDEGSNAGSSFRQTQVNGVIDTNNIIWVSFGVAVPDATETVAGKAEIATQAETNTGTDDARFVTPLKLANWTGRRLIFEATIGDGSATSITVTHNFGNKNVNIQLFNATNGTPMLHGVTRNTNNVVLNVIPALTLNEGQVLITR